MSSSLRQPACSRAQERPPTALTSPLSARLERGPDLRDVWFRPLQAGNRAPLFGRISVRRKTKEAAKQHADEDESARETAEEQDEIERRDGLRHTGPLTSSVPTETDHSDSLRLSVPATVGIGSAIAVGALLHLGRQLDAGAWASLWAEDGSVFLSDAHRDFAGTFLAQNGGYAHIVPRLIAGLSLAFPLDDAAGAFAVMGSVVVAATAAFVYFASGDVLRSQALRLVLAAAVLVLPVAGSELYANALNLHFYLVFACFWALFWQSESGGAIATRSAIAVVAPLSDPVSALLLPLALVAPLTRRSGRALIVSTSFVVGLAVQAILMYGGDSPERNWEFQLEDVRDILSLRVAGGLLVGDRFLDDAWLALGRSFSYAALAAVSVAIVALLLRTRSRASTFSLISLTYGLLFYSLHAVGRGTGGMDPELGSFHLNGARYVLLPFLFTLAAILALADNVRGRHADRVRAAIMVWLVAVLVLNYPVGPNARSEGPSWQEELTTARRTCADGNRESTTILVAPAPPNVWFVRIACSRL